MVKGSRIGSTLRGQRPCGRPVACCISGEKQHKKASPGEHGKRIVTIITEQQGGTLQHATSYLINSTCLSSEQQTLAEGLRWCQLAPLLILFLTSVFGPAAVRHSNLSRLKVLCCCLSAFPSLSC